MLHCRKKIYISAKSFKNTFWINIAYNFFSPWFAHMHTHTHTHISTRHKLFVVYRFRNTHCNRAFFFTSVSTPTGMGFDSTLAELSREHATAHSPWHQPWTLSLLLLAETNIIQRWYKKVRKSREELETGKINQEICRAASNIIDLPLRWKFPPTLYCIDCTRLLSIYTL